MDFIPSACTSTFFTLHDVYPLSHWYESVVISCFVAHDRIALFAGALGDPLHVIQAAVEILAFQKFLQRFGVVEVLHFGNFESLVFNALDFVGHR